MSQKLFPSTVIYTHSLHYGNDCISVNEALNMTTDDVDELADASGTLSSIHYALIAQMDMVTTTQQQDNVIVLCEYAQGHVEKCFQILLNTK